MSIERISQSLRFDLGDRFYILYGPGVNDTFIAADYRECKVEEALWLTLRAQKFKRIVFFSAQRGLYFLDDESRQLAHRKSAAAAVPTRASRGLSGGPLGSMNIAGRNPAPEGDQAERISPAMGETHILRLLNNFMQTANDPKTALVILQAENTLRTFEQQRSLAGWLGEWARLPRSNPHVCILLAASDLEEMLREPLQRPWSELPELTAQLKWRSGQNSSCNVARLGPPEEAEVGRLIEYARLKDGVQVEWLGRKKLERWMAAEGLWVRQWLANLVEAHKADAETARLKGWFKATNPDPRSAWERLQRMTGLESVKAKIQEMNDFLQVELERQAGKAQLQVSMPALHLVFLGNPGTGKTTVARLVGEMYRDMGLLKRGHTVSPPISELISNHVGESAIQTNAIIDQALDGILFIDEAYQLAEKERGSFGQEVIDTLLVRMENDRSRLVVIVAGYTQKMQDFLQSNPGLPRRFPSNNRIEFPDYAPLELEQILQGLLAESSLAYSSEMKLSLREVIAGLYAARDEKFGNAGEMRNLAEALHTARNSRVARDHLGKDEPIQAGDLPADYGDYLAPPVPELPDLMAELDALVGLGTVKELVRKLVSRLKLEGRRRQQGLKVARQPLHLVFTGNPGTGKTTVARLLGRIFKAVGLLHKGHIIEVDRSDLVADIVGGTALKTNDKIKKALDGLLFIDEAYALVDGSGTGVDFGKESINTLVKSMEDHRDRLVVIAAGYPVEMEIFLQSNPGLASRFTTHINFPDYTAAELVEILTRKAASEGYLLLEPVKIRVAAYLDNFLRASNRLPNAREINSLFTEMLDHLAERLDPDEMDHNALSTFAVADVPVSPTNPASGVASVTTRQAQAYPLRLPAALEEIVTLQTVQRAVGYVSIQMKDGSQASGTGFCITPQGEFLTAYHVVEKAQAIQVRLEATPGRFMPASLVGWDAAADLAVLRLPPGREYPWLALAEAGKLPALGEAVAAFGFPLGEQLGQEISFTDGSLSSLREHGRLIQFSATVTHGSSGGPLLRRSDLRVIGVVHGGARPEVVSGLNMAINIQEVYRCFGEDL